MSDSIVLPKMSLNNLIYSYIKGYINNIIPFDENRCYSENPYVDVESVAKNVGIKDVVYTSFNEDPKIISKRYNIKNVQEFTAEFYENENAFLFEVNGEYLIFVNSRKDIENQRFFIAHEIEHYISKKNSKHPSKNSYISSYLLAQIVAYLYLSSSFKINNKHAPKFNLMPDIEIVKTLIEHLPKTDNTTKRKTDYIKQLKKLEKKSITGDLITKWNDRFESKIIANDISILFNKNISEKMIRAIFRKQLKQAKKRISVGLLLFNIIKEVVEEEIADYFAANLLVSTESLILWENKPNSKTAQAFKVPVKCIKKRKKYEIKHELDYITLEYLTYDKEIEVSAPLKTDEMKHITGGYNLNDTGRD